jgi:hypothetical protein
VNLAEFGGSGENGNDAVYYVARSYPGAVLARPSQDHHISLIMKILFNVTYGDENMNPAEATMAMQGQASTVSAFQRLCGVYDNIQIADDLPFAFLKRALMSLALTDETKIWVLRLVNALLSPILTLQVMSLPVQNCADDLHTGPSGTAGGSAETSEAV